METNTEARETTTATVEMRKGEDGKVSVVFNGSPLQAIEDGSDLIKRTERVLRAANVYRTSGYEFSGSAFVATATQVL